MTVSVPLRVGRMVIDGCTRVDHSYANRSGPMPACVENGGKCRGVDSASRRQAVTHRAGDKGAASAPSAAESFRHESERRCRRTPRRGAPWRLAPCGITPSGVRGSPLPPRDLGGLGGPPQAVGRHRWRPSPCHRASRYAVVPGRASRSLPGDERTPNLLHGAQKVCPAATPFVVQKCCTK